MDIEMLIKEKLKAPFQKERLLEFKNKLKESKLLLYFGDNSAEIIFDKLLIETLKKKIILKSFLL